MLPQTTMIPTRVRISAALSVLSLGLACSGDPTAGRSAASKFMRVESVPASDTIRAMLAEPLVIHVDAPAGTPVVFRSSLAKRPTTQDLYVGTYFSRTPELGSARVTDTILTDATGRAFLYLRLGFVATEVVVTAVAPSLGDSVQAQITVKAGAPARLSVQPSDTAIYVGRRYALHVALTDAFDNPLPVNGLTFSADSAAVSVTSDGQVTSRAIGRASVRVQVGQRTTTAWTSVVPEGRIAAVRYGTDTGDSTCLVLVNLDGSAYRTFRLQLPDVPRPAWHPDGSYLVAPILPSPLTAESVPRLARLDTATGAWRIIPGTQEPQGDGNPQFSRDGQWIYLSNGAVSRVRADGTGKAERVGYDRESATWFDGPSLSPDESRVVMNLDVSFGMFTLIVPASPPLGRPPGEATLIDGLPTGGHPRWSPVGDDVLMFGTEGMWLMRAGARTVAERRYLAREWAATSHVTGGFNGAAWSPDGRWILAKAAATLILVEAATNRVLPLAFGSRLGDPAWRPR